MILGAHVSAAGGVSLAFERAKAHACKTFQIFCSSSRSWRHPELPDDEIGRFAVFREQTGMGPLAAHSSYLVNLAAPRGELRTRAIRTVRIELERAAALGLAYLVLHPGSRGDASPSRAIRRIASGLNSALQQAADGVTILIENTAGQGRSIGHDFAHIRDIIAACRQGDRLGLCFDTQHAFAAGHDLTTDEGYEETFAEVDRRVGMERLRAFHLNDSKRPLGSRVDRHENIGKGHLGRSAFARLLADERFFGLPGYLETPPLDGRPSFHRNLLYLKRLRRKVRREGASGRAPGHPKR